MKAKAEKKFTGENFNEIYKWALSLGENASRIMFESRLKGTMIVYMGASDFSVAAGDVIEYHGFNKWVLKKSANSEGQG